MDNNRFSGPLFLTGYPRSGTKLLRDLLNRHPEIGIPVIETNFIPRLVRVFGNPPALDQPQELERLLNFLESTIFCWRFATEHGRTMPRQLLADTAVSGCSWETILGRFLSYYSPPGRSDSFIWGDKTPAHLTAMRLLKAAFPQARFLHIIRDPRDVCLSAWKIWGISTYRTAHKWNHEVSIARRVGRGLGSDYQEIRYEALLDDPELVLRDACAFIGCDFIVEMLELLEPAEFHGAARNETTILSDNKGKFQEAMSPTHIRRIEEIVCPAAVDIGYELVNDVEHRPLGALTMGLHRLYNVYAWVRFFVRQQGWRRGLWELAKLIQSSKTTKVHVARRSSDVV